MSLFFEQRSDPPSPYRAISDAYESARETLSEEERTKREQDLSPLGALFARDLQAYTEIQSGDLQSKADRSPVVPVMFARFAGEILAPLKNALTQLIRSPLKEPEAIKERQAIIDELRQLKDLDAFMRSLCNVAPIAGSIDALTEEQSRYRKSLVAAVRSDDPGEVKLIERARAKLQAKLDSLRGSIGCLLEIAEQVEPLAHPRLTQFGAFLKQKHAEAQVFSVEACQSGVLTDEVFNAWSSAVLAAATQMSVLAAVAILAQEGRLNRVSLNPDLAEEYWAGWNLFYPETEAHKNDSPSVISGRPISVAAFGGSTSSGKSVSGVHQNFFIQALAQAFGYSTVARGNFHVYDTFLLLDRAGTDRLRGDSGLGSDERRLRESYPHWGSKVLGCFDEPFSTAAWDDLDDFGKGLATYIAARGGKVYLSTHSETLSAHAAQTPGWQVYHFASRIDRSPGHRGTITYLYSLAEGPHGSDAIELADTLNLVPSVSAKAKLAKTDELRCGVFGSVLRTGSPQRPLGFLWTPRTERMPLLFSARDGAQRFLTVYSSDNDFHTRLEGLTEPERYMLDTFRNLQRTLSRGSTEPIQDLMLSGERVPNEMLLSRQAALEAVAQRGSLRAVEEMATLINQVTHEGPRSLARIVAAMGQFNHYLNPCRPSTSEKIEETAPRAIAFLELVRDLAPDSFQFEAQLAELNALAAALASAEAAISARSFADVAKMLEAVREIPLTSEEASALRELAAKNDDLALLPEHLTRASVKQYLALCNQQNALSDSLLAFKLLASGKRPSEADVSEAKKKALRGETFSVGEYREFAVLTKIDRETPPAFAPNEVIANAIMVGVIGADSNPMQIPIGQLMEALSAEVVGDGPRAEAARALEQACRDARIYCRTYLPNGEAGIHPDSRFTWSHFAATPSKISERLEKLLGDLSADRVADSVKPISLFSIDEKFIGERLLKIVRGKAVAQGGGLFDSYDGWIAQWRARPEGLPNLVSQLRAIGNPYVTQLAEEIQNVGSRIGIPRGSGLYPRAHRKSQSAHSVAALSEREPLKYWRRYRDVARHYLTAQDYSDANAAASVGDVSVLRTILSERMHATSERVTLGAMGALFERKYLPTLQRLWELSRDLRALNARYPWVHTGAAEVVEQFLDGTLTDRQNRIGVSCIALKAEGRWETEQERLSWRKPNNEIDAAVAEIAERVKGDHPLRKMIAEYNAMVAPIASELTTLAAKYRFKPQKDERSAKAPSINSLESHLSNRFAREIERLFDFPKDERSYLDLLMREALTIFAVGDAIQEGALCKVHFNTSGIIDLKGVGERYWERQFTPDFKKAIVIPQDYYFSLETPGESIVGLNMSGKTNRVKLLIRGLSSAMQIGFMPATSASMPMLDGALYIDRVTTKEDRQLGSAGNELRSKEHALDMLRRPGLYFVGMDEPCSTMNSSDQSAFIQAFLTEVTELGHYFTVTSLNRSAMERAIEIGVPMKASHLGYTEDVDSGKISFSYRSEPGFAPALGVRIALQRGYPRKLLAGTKYENA